MTSLIRSAVAFLLALPVLGAEPVVRAVRCPDEGVQPQAVVDAGGKVHLIYLKGEEAKSDVWYTTSGDGGRTWGAAIRVNSRPGAAMAIGTVRGAQLAVGRGGRVHVAWMGSQVAEPRGPGGATPMLYARMKDSGEGFEGERNLITFAAGLDGGGSIAASPDSDMVVVAWHAPGPNGKGEENRCVYYAVSPDAGKTFEREQNAFYGKAGACGCCGMRVMLSREAVRVHDGAGGAKDATVPTPLFLYRGVEGDRRSMRLAGVMLDGAAGVGIPSVELDPWKIKTCPMSTASLVRDGGRFVAAWETDGRIRLYRGESLHAIRDNPEVVSVPGKATNRKHPSLAVNKDGVTLLAWAEGTGWKRGGTVGWLLFDGSLKPLEAAPGPVAGLPAWSLPTAVALADGSFLILY